MAKNNMMAVLIIASAFIANGVLAWIAAPNSWAALSIIGVSALGILITAALIFSKSKQLTKFTEHFSHKLRKTSKTIEHGQLTSLAIYTEEVEDNFESVEQALSELVSSIQKHTQNETDKLTTATNQHLLLQNGLQASSPSFLITDSDNSIVYVSNDLLTEINHLSKSLQKRSAAFNPNNVIGQSIFNILPQSISSALKAHHSMTQQIELVGQKIELQTRPLMTAQNEQLGVTISWQNLSSKAEKLAAATRQQQLESALVNIDANIALCDANQTITYVSEAMNNFLSAHNAALNSAFPELPENNIVGANAARIFAPHYNNTISLAGVTITLTENTLYDEHKAKIGAVIQIHDLSTEAEVKQLKQEKAQLADAYTTTSTAALVTDAHFQIQFCNNSFLNLLNDQAKHIQARSKFDIAQPAKHKLTELPTTSPIGNYLAPNTTQPVTTEITLGDAKLQLQATPLKDSSAAIIGYAIELLDVTEREIAQQRELENTRIKVALDNVTTNIMVADQDHNIVYTNEAVIKMMGEAAEDIQKDLPNMDPTNLLGQNIDVFHKNPEHQRHMLAALNENYKTNIAVGGRHFQLIATPVTSNTNERLGTVVEWQDLTLQHLIERDVEKLVQDVSNGRLGALIPTSNKEGFFLNISKGLNDLSQTVNAFVRDVSSASQKLSVGDLSGHIEHHYKGNFAEVVDSLNYTGEKLKQIVGDVQHATNSIRSSSEEISIGNDQLSSRTEKQASNLEETAASLEQLTSNVRNTASNASTADQAANNARDLAQNGEAIVSDAVLSMKAITESSNKIVEIISVIDDIAFQTNLLALNASVEAARAGEQGRGFAVVANEVRNLAQRSAVSAKEIKELIDVSSIRVNKGSDQVNKCGHALKEILSNVGELSMLISDIANSTKEQATGIGQVNQAVAELDDITQQNAALAEEASSASHSSLQLADEMVGVVNFFKLDSTVISAANAEQNTNGTTASSNHKNTSTSANKSPSGTLNKTLSSQSTPTYPSTSKTASTAASIAAKAAAIVVSNDEDDEWQEF